jgi:[citrate (pro-3S)-lyase] ligase
MDITLFAKEIAPCLNIRTRFAGEEPFDNITRQYNETMRRILPQYGMEFIEIPRKTAFSNTPISASYVRKLLKERKFDEIALIVPKVTLKYLKRGAFN